MISTLRRGANAVLFVIACLLAADTANAIFAAVVLPSPERQAEAAREEPIAADTWAVTRAFGIDLPFSGTFLLQAMLVVGVAVPTPGGVGSYHEAYRLGVTTFFDAPNDLAVAAAIAVHFISFVPILLLGLWFMVQDGLSVGRLTALAGTASEGKKETIRSDEVPILRPPRRQSRRFA